MSLITSLQNPRIKRVVKLRDKSGRSEQRRFLIDGIREIERACAAGVAFDEVFLCPELCRTVESQALAKQLSQGASDLVEVTSGVFSKISYGDRDEGVLAVAMVREHPLTGLPWDRLDRVAVIEGVEKPGNLGAILRSADGAGISALVVADARTDLYNPNTIRASLGTIFTLPLAVAASPLVKAALQSRGFTLFAARPAATLDYTQARLSPKAAMILGAEAEGLSPIWQTDDVTAISIPMRGIADSLNVSVSAAVLFYESLRQQTGEG